MKVKLSILIITIGVLLTLSFGINAQSIPTVIMEKPIKDMTISELQTKIAEILQVIQQLQVLIAQLTGTIDISAIPGGYTFNTILSYGTSSIDIKYLQIFLNQDPDTIVSSTEYGSPGQETTYYGPKTKQAITKFQTKYKTDISFITGYTIGCTGYLGIGTKTKMNQVLQQYRAGEQLSSAPDGAPAGEAGTHCGDSIAQRPNDQGTIEDCDGLDLRRETCVSQGYSGGTLSCNNDCSFNTSQCLGTGPGGGGGTPTPTPEPTPEPEPEPAPESTPYCGDGTCNGIETCSTCSEDCGVCFAIPTISQISQFGITWTFDKEYEYGQFANGDYWVVANSNVTIIGIDPASISGGREMNGSMVNPSPTNGTQGYDSAMAANTYASSYNAALDVSLQNPLILEPSSSLVSTISINEAGVRPQIKTAAVLTVLDNPAPSGSFRPSYSNTDKTIRFNKDDLDYSLLSALQPVGNTLALSTVADYFKRPWIDHKADWSGRYQHPKDNMPDYGREMSSRVGIGALMLHLDFTNQQKEPLLIRYIQLGIDLYGIVEAGGKRNWLNNGGHGSGRKWPILFAGLMLDDDIVGNKDDEMRNIGQKSGDYAYSPGHDNNNVPSDYIAFGEDDQTFYVKNTDIYVPPYDIYTYKKKYNSGTVNLINGRTTIEGVGTAWSALNIADYRAFGVVGDNRAYDKYGKSYAISEITNNTHLELSVPYDGETASLKQYVMGDFVGYGHCNVDKFQDFVEYTSENLGLPEWGIEHTERNSGSDGLDWGASYRRCCTTNAWAGFVLAARIMGAEDSWNHDALFDYMDRYMNLEVEDTWERQWSRFTEEMWDAYRADYRKIWQCVNGSTRNCSKQEGVCAGSFETCTGETWPGCDDSTYLAWNSNYKNPETSCSDGLDNDCDGSIDCYDSDCSGIGACPIINTWNCTSLGNFDDINCWSLGHIPVSGEDVIFNSTGTGNLNINSNTLPQDLESFTVEPGYTGTISFRKEFAVGGASGTQIWNVTNDIDILGGTMKIYGDADGTPVNGLGQEWRSVSGNITIGSEVTLDGVGLGFASGTTNGPCSHTNGACHGGGTVCGLSNTYGSLTSPTSLGSSGGKDYGGSGGSAIKLDAANIVIDGNISMYGNDGSYDQGSGSGGSIWLKGQIITGTGSLNVRGEHQPSRTNRGASSAGRIALTASDCIDFSGSINAVGGDEYYDKAGTVANCHGSGGTVYINASTSITSSGAISTTSLYKGRNITFSDTLLTLSGNYNATGVSSDGNIILDYTDCESNFTGAVFDPVPIDEGGCGAFIAR